MFDNLFSVLFTAAHFALLIGIYGLFIGVCWSPFLTAGRLRDLFAVLPPSGWRVNYVLWILLPALVWGFLFGGTLSVSLDVRPPTQASEIYVAGIDGIVVATLISLLLWPFLLLYVLPRSGLDWDPNEYAPKTIVLVVGSLIWYLAFLAGPAYILSIFAGFGDVMAGP
ncbi:hypothetical protein [Halorubrum sp. BV1]|uniref:hypothetical protein n=1 Tax=Halorubrum sp. BV1 TaxID=1498500 RepID=UPI00067968F7|nr:hypothetical protein [Halorubrum sp. BV1]